ncbi:MAG: hypothetical protein K2J10_12620, partial [Muribaculaceae bacterium]|nr:hypothetical protein [Muribaculaceae bacterium]
NFSIIITLCFTMRYDDFTTHFDLYAKIVGTHPGASKIPPQNTPRLPNILGSLDAIRPITPITPKQ